MSTLETTADFLRRQRASVIDRAATALTASNTRRYQSLDPAIRRNRLEILYDQIVSAAASRDLGDILDYARALAEERFTTGYDLSDVQLAVNALEAEVWKRIFSELEPEQFAEPLGLVSTILGATKDELAREYVSLATHAHAPSLDLSALFTAGLA